MNDQERDPLFETLSTLVARTENVEDLLEELVASKPDQDAAISTLTQTVESLKLSIDGLSGTVRELTARLMPFVDSIEGEVARAHSRITEFERHAPLHIGPMR